MEEKLIEKTKSSINQILEGDISPNNIEYLYKLSKINHMAKEDKNMYGNYMGRTPGYDTYGRGMEYGRNYGARGYDSRYRGEENLDRMYNEYGNYSYARERYGANEDTKRSLEYMLRSMEDFARMLKEEAQSQEEVNMIKQSAQRIAQM